jgi:hypothetical protein
MAGQWICKSSSSASLGNNVNAGTFYECTLLSFFSRSPLSPFVLLFTLGSQCCFSSSITEMVLSSSLTSFSPLLPVHTETGLTCYCVSGLDSRPVYYTLL